MTDKQVESHKRNFFASFPLVTSFISEKRKRGRDVTSQTTLFNDDEKLSDKKSFQEENVMRLKPGKITLQLKSHTYFSLTGRKDMKKKKKQKVLFVRRTAKGSLKEPFPVFLSLSLIHICSHFPGNLHSKSEKRHSPCFLLQRRRRAERAKKPFFKRSCSFFFFFSSS